MQSSPTLRQVLGATTLACAVLALCSAAPPLSGRQAAPSTTAAAPRTSSALDAFQKHQRSLRDSIVRVALAQVGTRYEFGGATPVEGFDCSGLVRYVFSQLHRAPPRLAAKQARLGTPIQRDQWRPGDLLTFGAGDSVTHVGIYVGNRKFVHASVAAGRVIVSTIDNPHSELIQVLKGGRRLLAIAESAD